MSKDHLECQAHYGDSKILTVLEGVDSVKVFCPRDKGRVLLITVTSEGKIVIDLLDSDTEVLHRSYVDPDELVDAEAGYEED